MAQTIQPDIPDELKARYDAVAKKFIRDHAQAVENVMKAVDPAARTLRRLLDDQKWKLREKIRARLEKAIREAIDEMDSSLIMVQDELESLVQQIPEIIEEAVEDELKKNRVNHTWSVRPYEDDMDKAKGKE